MTVSELLVHPSPVDWRLYHHEVMMGWRTAEEIQSSIDAGEPTWQKKYLGLSKIPVLVEVLTEELKADRTKKVVLFFETRDVGMALRESLKPYKPILLFKGTPDSQRAKRLKDFAKPWSRVAVVQIQAASAMFERAATVCFVECSAVPRDNAVPWFAGCVWRDVRLVLLAGTVDEALMRARWKATAALLEGVTA